MKKKGILLALILLLSLSTVVFAGDDGPPKDPPPPKETQQPKETPLPSETPTDIPTNTPTDVPDDKPTSTPINTPTRTPTNTPTDTPTSTPTNTPTDTPTSTPTSMPTNTPPPDLGDEWCSPGYWRNHLDSWTEHDVLFSVVIGEIRLSNLGERLEKTANPTLLEVLQGPQYYTGDAFNEVGDYLSEIYLNFNGIRVRNSCPLN